MIKKFCDICGKEVKGDLSCIELVDLIKFEKACNKVQKEDVKDIDFKDIPRLSDFIDKHYCCSNCYKKLKKMVKDSITK